MGFFNRNFDRPGPGVPKNAPRKKGAGRFFEVLGRDMGSLFKAKLLCALGFAPGAFFVGFGVMAHSLPITVLAGLLGGVLAGPCYAGLHDTVLRALRDEPGFWWHTYKRAFKSNWKASLVPGALLGILVSSQIFTAMFVLATGAGVSVVSAGLLGLNIALTGMCFPFLFGQLVLMDMPFAGLLKNSLFFGLGNAPRALLMALVQTVYWVAVILFLPISLLWCALFGFALMVLITEMIAYPVMDKTFDLEKQFQEKREKDLEDDS